MSIGQRIREERRRAGLTQEDLAKFLGLSQSYLSRIEKGQKDPPWGLLLAVMVYTNPEVALVMRNAGALD